MGMRRKVRFRLNFKGRPVVLTDGLNVRAISFWDSSQERVL